MMILVEIHIFLQRNMSLPAMAVPVNGRKLLLKQEEQAKSEL